MGHDDDLFAACIHIIDVRPSWMDVRRIQMCACIESAREERRRLFFSLSKYEQFPVRTTFGFLLFCCKGKEKASVSRVCMHSCCNVKREEARKRRRLDRDLASVKEAYVRTCVRRRIHYYVPTREEKSQTERQTDRQAGRV